MTYRPRNPLMGTRIVIYTIAVQITQMKIAC